MSEFYAIFIPKLSVAMLSFELQSLDISIEDKLGIQICNETSRWLNVYNFEEHVVVLILLFFIILAAGRLHESKTWIYKGIGPG